MPRVAEKQATYADYLNTPEGAAYQLIGGELVMTPAPNPRHQTVAKRLFRRLDSFVVSQELGEVYFSPIGVRLSEAETYQPDMVFVPREELHRIGEQSIDGPPALVVEILSPTNAYYDLVHKKDVYESSGVKEYWIVDPTEKTIEVLQNSPQGFIRFAKARQAGSVGSHVLQGFTVSLEEIFEGM